ncbi:ABC transporter permease [Arthrobacter sp. D3-16]
MKTIDIITSAAGNSFRSKTRTILTVTAVFIGAFTLTITSAIGTGVSSYIDTQIGAFGAPDVLSVMKATQTPTENTGPAPYDPERAAGASMQADTAPLTGEDLETIAAIPGILEVSAARNLTPRYIQYEDHGKFELGVNANASLTTPQLAAGEQLQTDGSERQILLVTNYVESMGFTGADDAVGKTVIIGVADYSGVIHEVSATVAGIQNETILASGAALNPALADAIDAIQNTGKPAEMANLSALATAHFDQNLDTNQVNALKTELATKGFVALTVADQIGVIQSVISGITGILNAFAVIALIAAGFGIINTLFMSVQERTREIGLMKAMGMGGGRIYALFSLEAVFIGLLGSLIGALAAVGTGSIANTYLTGTVVADLEGLQVLRFAPVPMALIILLVMLIAFLAGTLPARRAARQNPIDALRYE